MKMTQKGLTLVELILVSGLSTLILAISMYSKEADLEQTKAAQVGQTLFQYGSAVRNYLSQQPNPTAGTREGSAWLKNKTCGGTLAQGKEYLPCDFPDATVADPVHFGRLAFTTVIENTGSSPGIRTTATTTTTPFVVPHQGAQAPRSDLAGISALAAASAINAGLYPTSSDEGASPVSATTSISYKANPLTATLSVVASSAPDNDVWIRTDGSNAMGANLNFDSTASESRHILGVSRVQNLAAQVLMLGNASGISAVSGAGVIIDANSEVIGSARLRGTLSVDNGASVTGNVTATNDITANNDITSLASLVAGQSITAGNSVSAAGNVSGNGAIVGQIFYDANNTNYYFDPNNTSNLNVLQSQNISNAQAITSSGRIRTNEYFQLGVTAVEGTACAPNGIVAKSATGAALSCTSGLWASGGLQGQYVNMGSYSGAVTLATGSKAALIQVIGGNGTSCDVWDGINRYDLRGIVQGLQVAVASNANNSWAKVGYIAFTVPANTTYTITSAPYACNPGVFSVQAFNL